MTEMQVGDQTIRHDRAATAAIYASLKGGWAEDCLCVGCRNLMAQRDVSAPVILSQRWSTDAQWLRDDPKQYRASSVRI